MRPKIPGSNRSISRRRVQEVSLLQVHTALLESLDWDEYATEEAMNRALEIGKALMNNQGIANVRELKLELSNEYSETTCDYLIAFYECAAKMEAELNADENEEYDG